MANRIENISPSTLRDCRKQVSLSIAEVKKRVPKIEEIEAGNLYPTLKQLDYLADHYGVPRWVFLRKSIPANYRFADKIPEFRHMKDTLNNDSKTNSDVIKVMARVEALRELLIDLDRDMDQNISAFSPPNIRGMEAEDAAETVREWLGVQQEEKKSLVEWRTILEHKNIFIFMTSQYKGQSFIGQGSFRGCAIYHNTLPIIIVNKSDYRKAQTFTLFHELGHLLRKQSVVNEWEKYAESWCDQLAGAILMPKQMFSKPIEDFHSLDKLAKSFQVSLYACLVRQRQLRLISNDLYNHLREKIKTQWISQQNKQKERTGGPPRNRPDEIISQYGRLPTNIFFQAYAEKEINFHRLMDLLECKKVSYVSKIRQYIEESL